MKDYLGTKDIMKSFTRRQFLAVPAGLFPVLHAPAQQAMPLSFSTLGCPDWTWDQILQFAVRHGYSGVEIRGVQRQLDLPASPLFQTASAAKASLQKARDLGLRIIDLGSSATLHFPEGGERQKNLDSGRRFIELAALLECPYVRVYPDKLPKDRKKEETMDLIVRGLQELGAFAANHKVQVLIESHGDLLYTDDIVRIMRDCGHPSVGMIWDIVNMWVVTGEDPALVYPRIKPFVRHVHIKDLKKMDGKITYTLLGRGETPVLQAIEILRKDQYSGFYSFEWEKLWHPEIEEPEIALADYPLVMRRHFAER